MRLEKSLTNLTTALFGQLFGILITFGSRLVFIRILGAEYLGVNGLFSNILSVLSLVEVGIGPAIVFSLYKPLAFKDETQVKALMNFYARAYWVIGGLIMVLGLLVLPFLDILIKNRPDIPHLSLIYLLFLANSVISYFFAYKRSLIIADQNNYIATIYRYGFFFVLNVLQIIILLATRSFILYLIAQILITFLENWFVSRKAERMYPFIKGKSNERLDVGTKAAIFKNVKALIYHKIGGTVVLSTSNIIISAYLGVFWVGLYSNYHLITNSLNIIIGQFFTGIIASVGNLNAHEDQERTNFIFQTVDFITWWIYSFASICLLVLINPFISIWLGSDYLLNDTFVMVIVASFYVAGMRRAIQTFHDSMGLFWYDRYKPLIESAVNLVLAIYLVQQWGIVGVFAANIISMMTVCFSVEPYVLYKYGLKKSPQRYYVRYIACTVITVILSLITVYTCNALLPQTSIASLIGRLSICLMVTGISLIGFYKTAEFRYLLRIAQNIANKLVFKRK